MSRVVQRKTAETWVRSVGFSWQGCCSTSETQLYGFPWIKSPEQEVLAPTPCPEGDLARERARQAEPFRLHRPSHCRCQRYSVDEVQPVALVSDAKQMLAEIHESLAAMPQAG